MRHVLGTVDTRVTFRLEREFVALLRDSARTHPLNAPLADRIEALIDEGVTSVPATIEPQSLLEYDSRIEEGQLVFFTDDPELDLLIEAPALADEAFFVCASQLELEPLAESSTSAPAASA